ncbi:MAG: 50S ribosomal protein L24 [Parcubacteria group bacterium]|nr:50S ribosomal protein L24 [Parcubacteria group bacterium]
MRLKKGDNVIVISGKDRGKTGKITHAFPIDERVIVEGVNIRKKHRRSKQSRQKGQIVEFASPIHASNVMFVDPKTGKRTRLGAKVEGGKKVRVAKKSNTAV